ncbi:MAG TPA: hypothetical protein VLQ90_05320 [Pyrinomonadaceae bacterium]|nr:hypothetical protein [Pyrinomonadaceae bacterium]
MSETIADDRDLDLAYQAIARDPRYAHLINIPERIIRCLDHFGPACNRIEVRQKLRAYYLFIGVVDDKIDRDELEIGRDILEGFHHRVPCFDDRTRASSLSLVTEVLKQNISDDAYPLVVGKLHELYQAVVTERKAETITAYIEQRRVVGCLTAEVSYVLIRSLLAGDGSDLRPFLGQVGAVGCLVDSVIDLRADARLGLVSFTPIISDFLKLLISTLHEGLSVTMKHPALLSVFLEAVNNNVRDRFRASRSAPRFVAAPGKEGVPSVV